jgi:hypothetical protein
MQCVTPGPFTGVLNGIFTGPVGIFTISGPGRARGPFPSLRIAGQHHWEHIGVLESSCTTYHFSGSMQISFPSLTIFGVGGAALTLAASASPAIKALICMLNGKYEAVVAVEGRASWI